MKHIASCSFGKDSIATILLAIENNEPLDGAVFSEVMFDLAPNTSSERLERENESRCSERRKWLHIWRNLAGCCGADDLRPEERWKTFPTVSAVHRGNDGIPFNVDSLTISFAKWRTESIKAYGNAIVPQVMYRIFEAIEAVEATR